MSLSTEQLNQQIPALNFQIFAAPGMQEAEKKLREIITDCNPEIQTMCTPMVESGGKRIRPFLVLYFGMASKQPNDKLINAAVAAELIHMATLIHDDVIDMSLLRRNQPTANARYGNHRAVLAGDYLFAKSFDILSSSALYKELNVMVWAIQEMCVGEIVQAKNLFNANMTQKDYFAQIERKTASLLSASCAIGAIISGAKENQIDAAKKFGLYLGYCFQIIDDILDYTGKLDSLGKPIINDLSQGNITLPALILLESGLDCAWLTEAISKRKISASVKNRVLRSIQKTGTISKTFAKAIEYAEKAKACLNEFPDQTFRENLLLLTDTILSRTK